MGTISFRKEGTKMVLSLENDNETVNIKQKNIKNIVTDKRKSTDGGVCCFVLVSILQSFRANGQES